MITNKDASGLASQPVEAQSVDTRNNFLGQLTINNNSSDVRESKKILRLNDLNCEIAKRTENVSKTSKVTERSHANELKSQARHLPFKMHTAQTPYFEASKLLVNERPEDFLPSAFGILGNEKVFVSDEHELKESIRKGEQRVTFEESAVELPAIPRNLLSHQQQLNSKKSKKLQMDTHSKEEQDIRFIANHHNQINLVKPVNLQMSADVPFGHGDELDNTFKPGTNTVSEATR